MVSSLKKITPVMELNIDEQLIEKLKAVKHLSALWHGDAFCIIGTSWEELPAVFFYKHGLNLIPAWISDYFHCTV